MLRPGLDLCKSTGITLNNQSRVVVMGDGGELGDGLRAALQGQGVTVLALQPDNVEAQLQQWLTDGPIQGLYWLPAVTIEPPIDDLDLATWRELNRQRVKNLSLTMRTLYQQVNRPGTFLVAATRMGGLHGYGPEGATAPLGGAVSGFCKAYKREQPDALVKVVDFAANQPADTIIEALLGETTADPGLVEVGYWQGNRTTVTLVESPAGNITPQRPLNRNTIFLVTGAAGGITSAIVADLAAASGGTFYLLDLATAPPANDPNLALFRADKEALKQKLIADLKSSGQKPTPVMVDKQLMAIERQEAARRAIEAVEAAGGTAHYHSLNLLDGPALADVVTQIRQRHGRIDVLVHAGGIEISRALPDKEPAQFDLVFDIKADGFFSLLRAAKGLPIGATVVFSSVAGRFGNSGQTDYSAANDLLCKLTSNLRQWRPETQAIAIDWTAWGQIGMATRGSIPKVMEMAGIDMLPPEEGIPVVRRELLTGFQGEVVIANRLGQMMAEFDPTGGLDLEKANRWLATQQPPWLMVGKLRAARLYGGLEVETTLDPKKQPFLYDHAMDGTPLLPGVMGTEGFAQLAAVLAEGYRVVAVEQEQFLAPFKFYRMEPQTLHLTVMTRPEANNTLLAETTLRSVRPPAKEGLPVQEKVHFVARVRLGQEQPQPPTAVVVPAGGQPIEQERIYRIYFHGPAYKVLSWARVAEETVVGCLAANLPPNSDPAGAIDLLSPRLIELCFQTAGVWEMTRKGVLALPLGIGKVVVYARPEPSQTLYAVMQAVNGGAWFDGQVVDESGRVYLELQQYRTVQLPGQISL